MRTGFLKGCFPVAAKEWKTTILSLRFVIIAALLALAVLAGTYAIAPGPGGPAAPRQVLYGFTYYPDLNNTHPALAAFLASPTGDHLSGVNVHLLNLTAGSSSTGQYQVLDTNSTDSSGWVRFNELWESYISSQLALATADEPGVPYCCADTKSSIPPTQLNNTGQVSVRTVSLGGRSDQTVVSLVFADRQGSPIGGGDLYIWKRNVTEPPPPGPQNTWVPPGGWDLYRVGATDASGYYIRSEPLSSGQYLILARKGALNATSSLNFSVTITGGTDLSLRGPDSALAFAGILFIPLILPIMTLVLAYDAIARERSEGSLDLLLSKPVSRIGVAVGKLIGVLGSTILPVAAVLLAAAGLIWARTGQEPTSSFLTGLVASSFFLVLSYSIIFLAVSSLTRSLGMALMVSVLFFLLFAIFWGLISFLVATLVATPGSVTWFQVVVTMSLFSPTGVYQQFLTQSVSAIAGTFAGPITGAVQELPFAWVALAAVIWTVLPLTLFLWSMKYRVTEV